MAYSGEMRARPTLLALASSFLLVVITCGTSTSADPPTPAPPADMLRAPESNPKYGGILRWAGLADAPFFDLHQCDTSACATPMEPMYDTLLRYNPLDGGKTVIPDLAYMWEIAERRADVHLPPARRGHVPRWGSPHL